MLEFNIEPLSGQLVAHSEKCRFTSYWIKEGAWTYIAIVRPHPSGPEILNHGPYVDLDEAINDARDYDSCIKDNK